MRRITVLILFLIPCLLAFGQKDSLQVKLVLIGDAGELRNGMHPVISSVKQNIELNKKTVIVFLGDNVYKAGLPDDEWEDYLQKRAVLDTQLNIAEGTKAKVFFIPGNHDWSKGRQNGLDAILRQQHYVEMRGDENVHFYPGDGCPGPYEVKVSKDVVLVLMDSQWWLHRFEKPGIESDCPYKTEIEVLNHLEDVLTKNMDKLVVLAIHHPFRSYGVHGGYFTLKQHIFPLTEAKKNWYFPMPVIGTIYPIARGVFGTPQDLKHPLYANMIKSIEQVAKKHPHTIFVSGHEHNQQLIKEENFYQIVSGSAVKETRVSGGKHIYYRSDTTGFATLEVSDNKNVRVNFYNVHKGKTEKSYSEHLLNFSVIPPPEPVAYARKVVVPEQADSITISASDKYTKVSGFKRFLNGRNYRKVWAEPVKHKVFRLKEMGFEIESLAGGRQTKTVRLRDSLGRQWSLRTLDKDLSQMLPPNFRNSAAQDYLQDFVSTAHPYSPLIVPGLAKAENVVVAKPKIYFVPDDENFGLYSPLFANKICLLERREPTPDDSDTKSTEKLLNSMYESNKVFFDQKAALRARLLDFYISDWDRHFNQWRFGERDTSPGKLFYPIPRDRDQAFFNSDGLIVKLASRSAFPFLTGFRKEMPELKWFAHSGRDFDRLFLNQLDKNDWDEIATSFVRNLPDSVIYASVKNLPPEIYAISGKEFEEKLISRRSQIRKEALKYYHFVAKEVNVVGSNQSEYFKVSGIGKNVQVKMFRRTKESDSALLIYERIFNPKETKEIRLFGLNDDDFFEVDETVKSDIRLRIIGGKGIDSFIINGNIRNYLYDYSKGGNKVVSTTRRTRNYFSEDHDVNSYHPTGFEYDEVSFPQVNLGFNIEDGILAGLGFSRTTQGFRKQPYSTFQKLSSLYAPNHGAIRLNYTGDFTELVNKYNLLIRADVVRLTLNNFFGLGNNSVFDLANKGRSFYRVRYNYAQAEVYLTKKFADVLLLGAGPQVYRYWSKPGDNQEKILADPSLIGLDSAGVYSSKTYAGGKFIAEIDNLNNRLFPTRGILWNTQFSVLGGLTKNSRNLAQFTSEMTVYSSLRDPAKIVSVLRLGGGHIFTRNFEYFQALTLGQNNYLRGFWKNRYAGSSLAYGSFELRYKLFDSKSYVLPGAVGLVAFNDVGRVWLRNENSRKWHYSYGGGLYYAVYNAVLISTTMAIGEEQNLFNFTLGARFNLTF